MYEKVGNKKHYSKVYKKFIDSIELPDSYIDEICSSRYAQHFCSEEEINKFKDRWRKQ